MSSEHECHWWPFDEPATGTPTRDEPDEPTPRAAVGADPEPAALAERVEALEDLLGSIWLYVAWYRVTRQLTTEQKDLWADVVDAGHRAQDEAEGLVGTNRAYRPVERWWRH